MTLWVAERYPELPLVINDANQELILLYRCLAKDEARVTKMWQNCVNVWLPYNPTERKAYYYTLRDAYTTQHDTFNDFELSGMLLFMMQVNFNGMWKVYKICNGRYSTAPGTCTQGAEFFAKNSIRQVSAVLRRCQICCGDFEDVDVRPGDFIYADPPYRGDTPSGNPIGYVEEFGEQDQVRLARWIQRQGGYFAYSNKEIGDGFIEDVFDGQNIHGLDALYTAGNGGSLTYAKEVLVTNYDSTLPNTLFS